ncbi:hypothetical protein HT031_006867 [Scenedesmus sp. PABB004]|nr:hypothetical protein HT031_006867 [Scenedesmus sp. PABB004]
MRAAAALLLPLLLACAAAQGGIDAGVVAQLSDGCPLRDVDFNAVDFGPIATACADAAAPGLGFCASCVCGVGTALVAGMERAGVALGGVPVAQLAAAGDLAGVNALVTNCSALLGAQLLASGALSGDALAALGFCQVDGAALDCAALAGAPPARPAAPPPALAQAAAAPRTRRPRPPRAPAAPHAARPGRWPRRRCWRPRWRWRREAWGPVGARRGAPPGARAAWLAPGCGRRARRLAELS